MRRVLSLFVLGVLAFVSWTPSAESQVRKKPASPIWSDQKDAFGDPLPIGAIARIGTMRYRLPESGMPQSIALSPDGKLLAAMGLDDIFIWELPAWKRHRVIRGRSLDKANAPQLMNLMFSADSKKLLTYDANLKIFYLLDVATGKTTQKLALGEIDPGGTLDYTLSANGQTLVCTCRVLTNGGMVEEVHVWDLAKGKRTQMFKTPMHPTGGQQPSVISADGRWLARCLLDQDAPAGRGNMEASIEIWNVATGKRVHKTEADGAFANPMLVFSADGKWLAAAIGQSTLRVYDVATGKEKHNIRQRRVPITYLGFSPAGSLYVGDQDGRVQQWDPVSGERTATHEAPIPNAVNKLAFAADGKVLALGFDLDAIHFWDVAAGKLFSPTGVPAGRITEVAFAPKGELFVACEDGTAAWWNARTGAKLRDLKLERDGFDDDARVIRNDAKGARYNMLFTMPEKAEFLAASDGNTFSFYETATGKLLYGTDLNNSVDRAVTFLEGGSKVASIQNGKVRIWNTRTGRDITAFNIPLRNTEQAVKLSASPDGKHLAITALPADGGDVGVGRVLLWDMAKQKIIRELSASGRTDVLKFSPDGQWLALAGADEQVQLTRVNAAKGEVLLRPGKEERQITQIAFSRDARQLALAVVIILKERDMGRVVVYEMASKKIRLELVGHPDGMIECLAFSPDGGLLATGSADTTALVWQAGLRRRPGTVIPAAPSDAELADWYQQMAGANAKAAFQNMIKLVRVPTQTIKLFADKIAVAQKPTSGDKTVSQWIHDLGSSSFAVRSKANAVLQSIGSAVEPELRIALPKAKDVETKRRLEELLDRIVGREWTQEEIAQARAIEVLEAIGSAEARAVLTRWSGGDSGAILTQESQRALAYLKK